MSNIPNLKWRVRVATEEEDIPLILDLCYQLSVYEKIEFEGTEELYRRYGFSEDKIFDCLLAENTGDVGPEYLGVVLYYYTFSTFESKPTLFLEDLFVPKEIRGNGVGTSLLKELCRIAIEKECGRLEWTVLDWNVASRQFFFSLGAKALDEWTTFSMNPEAFNKLADT